MIDRTMTSSFSLPETETTLSTYQKLMYRSCMKLMRGLPPHPGLKAR